ncbi:hypothetical protein [Actinoplanes aureus]|uniref:Uncharacterized protein n=1 Tax=Actinoplanes aureus TaxID=2792083 RepID=A0A931BZY2_9ACTN|nr:hypothetical protein [Actinoplanes aureus]MBG0560705.1 hypothetical protein [Actinoplanes aureus]
MLNLQPHNPAAGRRPYIAAATFFALEAAEARAGAHRLAHDQLALVTGTLLATIDSWHTGETTVDAYEKALADVRHTLTRDIDSLLPDNPQPLIGEAAAFSVPPARTRETPQTYADARAARAVLGPLRQLVPDEPTAELPMAGTWGPYETEQQVHLEPLPVAISELYDAGLIRPGDPEGLLRNTTLAHMVAACEAAGVRRGAHDDRVLERIAGSGPTTAQVLIGLIRRAYAAGADSAQ